MGNDWTTFSKPTQVCKKGSWGIKTIPWNIHQTRYHNDFSIISDTSWGFSEGWFLTLLLPCLESSPPPPAIQILYYHSNIKRQIVVHCCSYNWINSLTFELQNTFLVVGQDWSSDKINKESLAYILNYWCFSSLKLNLGGTLKGKYGPHIFHYLFQAANKTLWV